MKLFCDCEKYKIYNGSMLDMLEVIEQNSIDSIVCDPPYELGFMGEKWDSSGIAFQPKTWEKCLKVLKPGGYLLAFGGSRTFHRIACAIEDAGFEIRNTIMWLYGSGFPKSHDISKAIDKKLGAEREKIGERVKLESFQYKGNNVYQTNRDKDKVTLDITVPATDLAKQWNGWGTALKPAHEPIIVARKPFKGSLVENIMNYGVGGINIDECRIDYNGEIPNIGGRAKHTRGEGYGFKPLGENCVANTSGRFPANVIHDGSEEATDNMQDASRYFYTAKISKKDREEGLEALPEGLLRRMKPDKDDNNPTGLNKEKRFAPVVRKNFHPTVKPTELMQYLIRLVSPKGATILDPFMGSGSTGKAAMFENRERDANYKFIGIDLEKKYCAIAQARIDYALNKYEYDYQQELKKAEEQGQISFDLFGDAKETK